MFDRNDERYASAVTLDQVGFSSKKAPKGKSLPTDDRGIGNYRYGIVLSKVKENFWSFQPIRSLDSNEAKQRQEQREHHFARTRK